MTLDFSEILLAVVRQKASDLHLTAGAPPMLRVRGALVPMEGLPHLTPTDTREIVYAILNSSQRQRLETEWQIDFAYSIPGHARFRVNTYFQRGTIGAAFRLIPAETVPIEKLGLPPVIREFARKPRGIVLVTGPTGSGKSTTLAAVINYINEKRRCHILTVEDPVEYVHPHKNSAVSQREVGYDTISFARALRAAMREDPDVILVGEMRDPETVQFALSIAETGHLVFATLHTNDAPQALDRISDMFPAERQNQIKVQLAACLSGVVSQRLIPRIGGGMVAAFEILVSNSAVRGLIRDGKTHQVRNVLSSGRNEGMCTLESWLNVLIQDGSITYEDAVVRTLYPKEIRPQVPVPAGVGSGAR
jgi:twitching motility protein PilT